MFTVQQLLTYMPLKCPCKDARVFMPPFEEEKGI